MRATTASATAAIAGGAFAIAYGAIEVTAAAAGLSISDGVRIFAATVIALAVLGPCGLAILCRQRTIIDELKFIRDLLLTDDRLQAQREYDAIRRQLEPNGKNVIPFSKE